MNGHLPIFRWTNFYTFKSLGVWVWDPKPVYRLQNSSGYGTEETAFNSSKYISWVLLKGLIMQSMQSFLSRLPNVKMLHEIEFFSSQKQTKR